MVYYIYIIFNYSEKHLGRKKRKEGLKKIENSQKLIKSLKIHISPIIVHALHYLVFNIII